MYDLQINIFSQLPYLANIRPRNVEFNFSNASHITAKIENLCSKANLVALKAVSAPPY
jgi:hypothetical protein